PSPPPRPYPTLFRALPQHPAGQPRQLHRTGAGVARPHRRQRGRAHTVRTPPDPGRAASGPPRPRPHLRRRPHRRRRILATAPRRTTHRITHAPGPGPTPDCSPDLRPPARGPERGSSDSVPDPPGNGPASTDPGQDRSGVARTRGGACAGTRTGTRTPNGDTRKTHEVADPQRR